MGATRPAARSAAKKGASKIKAGAKKQASKDPNIDMDSDNYEPAPEGDDDDSDEYIEPPKDKNSRQSDDEDDEDEHMDVDEELDEDKGIKPKKQRRRKQTNNFSIPLEEMNRLLTTSNIAGTQVTEGRNTANSTVAGTELSLERMGGEDVVVAPVSLRAKANAAGDGKRRAQRARPNKPMHKKGEMHSSEFIPSIWKHSYQGPTQRDVHYVSMQPGYLKAIVYPNITSNTKDFRVITESSDLDEYFPVLTTTRIHTREQDIDMRTMTATYIESTKQTGINDYYILNAGFSVWAMDWCPLPSHSESPKDNMDYVAIGGFPDTAENCIARDQLYPLGKQDAHPNMIQIWSMNCNTNDQGELQGNPETYLSLCILHSYGAVLDLKWCPTGGLMDAGSSSGDLARLGILAAAFSDGTIRIFSVPEPRSLRAHLGIVTPVGSSPDPVYIEFPDPFATIRMGDICFMCINWGTSERLAAGLTNGTIAVWDMKLMLSQTKETLAEKDSEYLDPIHLPQVHDVSVRCVDWLRSVDPSDVPWILASSGYDGRIRYTDLRDIYVQIDIKTILGVPMASLFNSWAEAIIYCDFDFGGKMDQLYLESRGFRLFNAKGTIWDFSSSDYQPFVAAAISDGRVKISNPAYKAKRGYGMIQNNLYQVQENTMDVDGTSQIDSSGQTEDNGRTRRSSYTYREGEEREYISKTAGYLSFYGANVAVQKVQWSKCFHSAAWLASGSAGGLVRIDNTMLRQEEGGEGNKITYQPDAYLLKKRIAKGGVMGPDGQFVPARKGRPPKEGGPRRLNKGKNAKGATAKTKATTRKGAKSKSANDDHDSDDEEPEAEESGHDNDNDDDDDDNDGGQSSSTRGLRDEDEFVGRAKDPGPLNGEKRATRLSTGKLAPIFARQSSKTTAASEEEDEGEEEGQDEDGVEEGERGEGEVEGVSSPSKKLTRKPARAAVVVSPSTKDPPKSPAKPRGRPRKNPPPVDPVASNQTLLSMMKISRPEPSGADGTTSMTASKDISSVDVEMTEVVMEETIVASVATEATTTTATVSATATIATAPPKSSAAGTAAPKKPRGRPPKAKPVTTETTTEATPDGSDNQQVSVATSKEAAPAQGANIGAAAGAADNRETMDMQREDDPRRESSESAASSRSSSVVPEAAAVGTAKVAGTPGKKEAAAPRMTRKRKDVEKNKATNRTLTDLWGKK